MPINVNMRLIAALMLVVFITGCPGGGENYINSTSTSPSDSLQIILNSFAISTGGAYVCAF
jgi:hypothetical protein